MPETENAIAAMEESRRATGGLAVAMEKFAAAFAAMKASDLAAMTPTQRRRIRAFLRRHPDHGWIDALVQMEAEGGLPEAPTRG